MNEHAVRTVCIHEAQAPADGIAHRAYSIIDETERSWVTGRRRAEVVDKVGTEGRARGPVYLPSTMKRTRSEVSRRENGAQREPCWAQHHTVEHNDQQDNRDATTRNCNIQADHRANASRKDWWDIGAKGQRARRNFRFRKEG